jgi:hypothetical protein
MANEILPLASEQVAGTITGLTAATLVAHDIKSIKIALEKSGQLF